MKTKKYKIIVSYVQEIHVTVEETNMNEAMEIARRFVKEATNSRIISVSLDKDQNNNNEIFIKRRF